MARLEFVISPIKINKDNKIFIINLIDLIVMGNAIVLSNSNVTHLSKKCFVY
jgi:hypothetical protein